MKSTCRNSASRVPTESLWQIILEYGQPFQMIGKSKKDVEQKCINLGIGVYSSPIKEINKVKNNIL